MYPETLPAEIGFVAEPDTLCATCRKPASFHDGWQHDNSSDEHEVVPVGQSPEQLHKWLAAAELRYPYDESKEPAVIQVDSAHRRLYRWTNPAYTGYSDDQKHADLELLRRFAMEGAVATDRANRVAAAVKQNLSDPDPTDTKED